MPGAAGRFRRRSPTRPCASRYSESAGSPACEDHDLVRRRTADVVSFARERARSASVSDANRSIAPSAAMPMLDFALRHLADARRAALRRCAAGTECRGPGASAPRRRARESASRSIQYCAASIEVVGDRVLDAAVLEADAADRRRRRSAHVRDLRVRERASRPARSRARAGARTRPRTARGAATPCAPRRDAPITVMRFFITARSG